MNLSKFVLYNIIVIFLLLFFEKLYGNQVIFWMTFVMVGMIMLVLLINVIFGVWYLLEYRCTQMRNKENVYLRHALTRDSIK